MKFFTHLIQRRRGPEIAQYTDGQDQVIEQRTWFLLPLLTPPKTLRACVGPSSLMPKTNCKEVVWWANAKMNCAAIITPSLGLFVLAFSINLLLSNEQF